MDIKCKIFHEDNQEFSWDKEALETFKNKINEHKIKCRMDDIFLLGFLRARKYDQERSLQLLMNYYSRRIEHPEYFKDLVPSKLEHVLSLKSIYVLPKPDQEGRYIFVTEPGKVDISVRNNVEYFRTIFLIGDFQLNFHLTQEKGIIAIHNGEGVSLKHVFFCNPKAINSFFMITQKNSYPIRVKEIHFVNIHIFLKAILSILIPFLPQKFKERIHLHNDMSSLHKFVHPQYLPAKFGGELPDYDPIDANEMIKENEEYFRKNEEYVKLYKEAVDQKFIEGSFKYTKENTEDDNFKKLLQDTEMKLKCLKENPEKFLSIIEKEFEITHL